MSTKKPAKHDKLKGLAGKAAPSGGLSEDQLDAVSGGAGGPSLSEITVSKTTDTATPGLFQTALGGSSSATDSAAAFAITLPSEPK